MVMSKQKSVVECFSVKISLKRDTNTSEEITEDGETNRKAAKSASEPTLRV